MEDFVNPDLRFSDTGFPMQLDLFLPSLLLAFEYNGRQHYQDVPHRFPPQKHYANRDEEKRKACICKGITLIEIPYWWDEEIESLRATIHNKRPDLIVNIDCGNSIEEKKVN